MSLTRELSLTGMQFTIKFNKPVKDLKYLSPGGYEIRNAETGEIIFFDFYETEWSKRRTKIDVCVRKFDDSVSNGRPVYLQDLEHSEFTDFYIDMEDVPNDSDLRPIGIEDASMFFESDKEYSVVQITSEQLEQINNIIAKNGKNI